LGGVGVVPEVVLGGFGLKLRYSAFSVVDVKDTSAGYRLAF
jgi:hypothetical protein